MPIGMIINERKMRVKNPSQTAVRLICVFLYFYRPQIVAQTVLKDSFWPVWSISPR